MKLYKTKAEKEFAALAEDVKEECLHAWQEYVRYAWGYDELRPLSQTGRNWYEESLCITPIDALDTLLMLGFEAEAGAVRESLLPTLSFDKDMFVSVFEVNIRLLGGLLAAYQLTQDQLLLALAEDLGNRLLPAFGSRTSLPFRLVNLKTGEKRGVVTNPAEAGTFILEFGLLSRLTNNKIFFETALQALRTLFESRSSLDLVGIGMNVHTGKWVDTHYHLGAKIDSYIEYLVKGSIFFENRELTTMAETMLAAIDRYLTSAEHDGLWYRCVNMESGQEEAAMFGALEAFFPAVLALWGEGEKAAQLQQSVWRMWRQFGLAPEAFDFRRKEAVVGNYYLRPEVFESAYYLYHTTRDTQYAQMNLTLFTDLRRSCRTASGYAVIEDVRTMKKQDEMKSFLFSEVFKYCYLTCTLPPEGDLKDMVFTTEGHPFHRIRSRN